MPVLRKQQLTTAVLLSQDTKPIYWLIVYMGRTQTFSKAMVYIGGQFHYVSAVFDISRVKAGSHGRDASANMTRDYHPSACQRRQGYFTAKRKGSVFTYLYLHVWQRPSPPSLPHTQTNIPSRALQGVQLFKSSWRAHMLTYAIRNPWS